MGSIVAMVKGTKAKEVSNVLEKISYKERLKTKEITLDMANSMDWISRTCFPNAEKITDRFHAQKLVSEALQEMRIKTRWKAIEEENREIDKAKKEKKKYMPYVYENGDTKKQLLARSRYLLFKPKSKWIDSQKERAKILFREFPKLAKAYELSMMFRSFYEYSHTKEGGKEKLECWYNKGRRKDKRR